MVCMRCSGVNDVIVITRRHVVNAGELKMRKYENSYPKVIGRPCISTGVYFHTKQFVSTCTWVYVTLLQQVYLQHGAIWVELSTGVRVIWAGFGRSLDVFLDEKNHHSNATVTRILTARVCQWPTVSVSLWHYAAPPSNRWLTTMAPKTSIHASAGMSIFDYRIEYSLSQTVFE